MTSFFIISIPAISLPPLFAESFEDAKREKLAASKASVSARIAELQQLIAARKLMLSQPVTVGTLPGRPPSLSSTAATANGMGSAEVDALGQLQFGSNGEDGGGGGDAAGGAAAARTAGAAKPEGVDAAANNVRRALKRLAFAKTMLDSEAAHSVVPAAGVILDMCDALDEDHFNETAHNRPPAFGDSASPSSPATETAAAAGDAGAGAGADADPGAAGGVEEIDLGLDSDAESDSTWNSGTLPPGDDTNANTTANATTTTNTNGYTSGSAAHRGTSASAVAAHNVSGGAATQASPAAAEQVLSVPPVPTQNRSNRRALLIAINYNGTTMQLEGCTEDQQAVHAMLLQQGFQQSDIGLLNESTGISPTRANIEAGLRWLVRQAQPGDVHFLHVASRGWQMQTRMPVGAADDGFDKYLVPLDYQTEAVLSEADCKSIINDDLPAGAELVAVFDTTDSAVGLELAFHWDPAHAGWKLSGAAAPADPLAAKHGTILCFSCHHNGPQRSSGGGGGGGSSIQMLSTITETTITETSTTGGGGGFDDTSGDADGGGDAEAEADADADTTGGGAEHNPLSSSVYVEGAPDRGKLTACFERAIASGNRSIQDVFAAVTGLMLETATALPTLSSNVQMDGNQTVLRTHTPPAQMYSSAGNSYFE